MIMLEIKYETKLKNIEHKVRNRTWKRVMDKAVNKIDGKIWDQAHGRIQGNSWLRNIIILKDQMGVDLEKYLE